MPNTFFVSRVKLHLDKLGVTQKELAEAIGVLPQTFNGYMTMRREIPVHILLAVADYLDVSTDYLLGRTREYKSSEEY